MIAKTCQQRPPTIDNNEIVLNALKNKEVKQVLTELIRETNKQTSEDKKNKDEDELINKLLINEPFKKFIQNNIQDITENQKNKDEVINKDEIIKLFQQNINDLVNNFLNSNQFQEMIQQKVDEKVNGLVNNFLNSNQFKEMIQQIINAMIQQKADAQVQQPSYAPSAPPDAPLDTDRPPPYNPNWNNCKTNPN